VHHFRIFDSDGKVVVDIDEQRLEERARQEQYWQMIEQLQEIKHLRKQLQTLWPPHELTRNDKDRVTIAVTSIVGQTLLHFL
jgi:hypothetical protein